MLHAYNFSLICRSKQKAFFKYNKGGKRSDETLMGGGHGHPSTSATPEAVPMHCGLRAYSRETIPHLAGSMKK